MRENIDKNNTIMLQYEHNLLSYYFKKRKVYKMIELGDVLLSETEKNKYIDALTPELNMLRAKAEISQEGIANFIGISRQSYGAIERRARRMTWNIYLSLIMFYDYNKKTHKMIRQISTFPHKLMKLFCEEKDPHESDLDTLFKTNSKKIFESLDEKAISTIKTIVMVEYSRCNNISSEAVVKFFEGADFLKKGTDKDNVAVMKSLKNIKRNRHNDK